LEKKKATRKNRYKKNPKQARQKFVGRLKTGLKLVALIAAVLGFSSLFMAGYAAVTHTAYFRIATIQVHGVSRLNRHAVLAQAKIRRGDNLLAVNLALVRKRLLAHPWIASARVSREIPATISIDIVEHQALAVLKLDREYLIDTDGRIFKTYEADDPQDLPKITGMAYADISLGGDQLSPVMAAAIQALQVSRGEHCTIPYAQIRELHVDPKIGVVLTAWQEGRRIKLGFGRFQVKFERIGELLAHLKKNRKWRDFVSIDGNNPDRIVVQLGSPLQKGA
jgi:cell division protein FtsQ